MHKTLEGIDVTAWVLGAASAFTNGQMDWLQCWVEQYSALGGSKPSVARKSCPMTAAYGLLRIGHLRLIPQLHTAQSQQGALTVVEGLFWDGQLQRSGACGL